MFSPMYSGEQKGSLWSVENKDGIEIGTEKGRKFQGDPESVAPVPGTEDSLGVHTWHSVRRFTNSERSWGHKQERALGALISVCRLHAAI